MEKWGLGIEIGIRERIEMGKKGIEIEIGRKDG